MFARSATVARPAVSAATTAPRVATLRLRTFATSSTLREQLVLAERQGPVTVLTLNRPKALNALSTPLFTQLNAELDKVAEDDSVKAVVLTGSEKAFAGKWWCDGNRHVNERATRADNGEIVTSRS